MDDSCTHTPLSVLVKVLDLQPCDANSLKLLGCNSMKIRFSGTKINITAISQYVNRYLLASIFCSPQQAFLSIFVKEIVSLSKYSANNIPRALFALHKLKWQLGVVLYKAKCKRVQKQEAETKNWSTTTYPYNYIPWAHLNPIATQISLSKSPSSRLLRSWLLSRPRTQAGIINWILLTHGYLGTTVWRSLHMSSFPYCSNYCCSKP
jgi:hypothetical protein